RAGRWELWIRGEVMPRVAVAIDGRRVTTIAGQLEGNAFNPDTLTPVSVTLAAGAHVLRFAAAGSPLAPGDGGTAIASRIFLTPPGAHEELVTASPADWQGFCGRRLGWVEAVRA
ncbi:MAG TPA: hypothetical protein VL977_02375, partial [Solirubrobacteraceae bacterium]|nr:hypothetical protein [Solirubrobacteraceae bacterium]